MEYEQRMANALAAVTTDGLSFRKAGAKFNLNPSTVQNRMNKMKSSEHYTPYESCRVFSATAEAELMDYFNVAAKIHHGIFAQKARELAYEFAMQQNLSSVPKNWHNNRMAGDDWVRLYVQRHPQFVLRTSATTTRANDVAANDRNVNSFFANLAKLYSLHNFEAHEIYNLGETDLHNVLDNAKSIALQNGHFATMIGIISASGSRVPPIFVLPKTIPESCDDSVGKLSLRLSTIDGQMTSDLFIDVLKHLKKHTLCTKEHPVLLILDGHRPRSTIASIQFCRENGIEVISTPLHCSQKLLPFKKCLAESFKPQLLMAIEDFVDKEQKAGDKPVTISDLPTIAIPAYRAGFTAANIRWIFMSTGIFPYQRRDASTLI